MIDSFYLHNTYLDVLYFNQWRIFKPVLFYSFFYYLVKQKTTVELTILLNKIENLLN